MRKVMKANLTCPACGDKHFYYSITNRQDYAISSVEIDNHPTTRGYYRDVGKCVRDKIESQELRCLFCLFTGDRELYLKTLGETSQASREQLHRDIEKALIQKESEKLDFLFQKAKEALEGVLSNEDA